jgi:hypothetical protein
MSKKSIKRYEISAIMVFILLTALSCKSYSQGFDAFTSKIFFGVDLKNKSKLSVANFNCKLELVLMKDTGWTICPPLDENENLIPNSIYEFHQHPHFLDFTSGHLLLLTTGNNDKILGLEISLIYDSKREIDSTYSAIRRLYKKYSLKVIKRPNLVSTAETLKCLSKNNKDFVIIGRGEDGKRFHLSIAYDYQGYKW